LKISLSFYLTYKSTQILHRENPPRQVISISPTYNYAAIRPSQPYLDPTSGYLMFSISEHLAAI